MIALFFEVTPKAGEETRYLDIAGSLRPALEASGGVLFLDRYKSHARPRTLLSHQIWADEASLVRWRSEGRHYGAQKAGRESVFEDYRLRVGPVIAEGGEGGGVVPQTEGIAYNDPLLTPERFVIVVRSHTRPVPACTTGETYESVYRDKEYAWIGSVADRSEGYEALRRVASDACVGAAQLCLVSRDYGLHDRREAPQYFPSAQR
ncbi:MAG: antibiotic biosynthesis monooxygenase [Hyphomicrobiaceae bacterium]|nr:antibiotic biosynthesis monooxygenase [Hyphomicrobiaceae bacterium]